ncbi:histone acetyltransferase subunit 3-like protein [Thozetella sp. PMI_491]|nr:histone acetyltransferase subunit 3-like protein [Thozetella sp. PMI_491]
MAPSSSQGTGKKGGGAAMRQQNRSRNTTPSSVPSTASLPAMETVETELVDLRFELFRNLTYEDMVDPSASSAVIPDSKSLDGMVSRLAKLGEVIERRGTNCDRGMRLLAQHRKSRMDDYAAERGREEERRQREADDEERERKANKKKRKATDTLAPQGGNIERSSPLRDSQSGKPRKLSRDDSASSSLSPVAPRTPSNMDMDDKTKAEEDESSSDDDGRPPPPARPQANTFGDDPSTFPDPTVYEVREILPGMSEEEIKEIYSVANYPHNDLSNLIAGDPPDKDFSSAKPSNQINFSTFSTYIDPYFRSFTEEDLAFLRERGDRSTPFVMPKRGKKHYTDIWAEEDGAMAIDSSPPGSRDRLPPNQPRGNIEGMDDDLAETDKLSVGPLLSRLLQAMRPENRAPPAEDKPLTNGVGADGTGDDFDFGISLPGSQSQTNGVNGLSTGTNGLAANGDSSLPSATFMAESNTEAWKKATHPKLDYAQVDERIKQELRHIGFLPTLPHDPANPNAAPPPDPATTADYDGHFDDEVAARLRLLQARLREQVLINGARKARLTDLVKERMAYQEYQTILEDLDSQVQAAYLKRTRTMGKKPKKARPGASAVAAAAAAASGLARPGIGDMTKTLMERRRRWIDNIGTVFDDESLGKVPRVSDPDSSIFKAGEMGELMKREQEAWDEEVDEEE